MSVCFFPYSGLVVAGFPLSPEYPQIIVAVELYKVPCGLPESPIPFLCYSVRKAKREVFVLLPSPAGEAAGSLSLRWPSRRRVGGGTPDPRSWPVDRCRGWVCSGGVRMVVALSIAIRCPRFQPHLAGDGEEPVGLGLWVDAAEAVAAAAASFFCSPIPSPSWWILFKSYRGIRGVLYRCCRGGGPLGDWRLTGCPSPEWQRGLPRLPVRPCLSSPLSLFGAGGEFACDARDGLPAAALEPDLSSRPLGWALLRYSMPVMATAYAGGWTLGVHLLSAPCRGVEEDMHGCGEAMVEDDSLCNQTPRRTSLYFSLFWGCLCIFAATAVLEVSRVGCACLYRIVLI